MDNNIIDKYTPTPWRLVKTITKENQWIESIGERDRGDVICLAPLKEMIDSLLQWPTNAAFIVKACNEYEGLHKEIEWHKGIEEKLLNENEELLEALKDARTTLVLANLIDKSNTCEKSLKVVEEAIKKHSPIN